MVLGDDFAEAAEEALAGGNVLNAGGFAGDGGVGSFKVGGAEVAEVAAGDESDVIEVNGGVGGGAELLRADMLQAGQFFRGARGVDGGEALAVGLIAAKGTDAAADAWRGGPVVAGDVAPEAGAVGLDGCAVAVILVEEIGGEPGAILFKKGVVELDAARSGSGHSRGRRRGRVLGKRRWCIQRCGRDWRPMSSPEWDCLASARAL